MRVEGLGAFYWASKYEEQNNQKHLRIENVETKIVHESEPSADNVIPIHYKVEAMIPTQIVCTKKHMIRKEKSIQVTSFLDNILQWTYEQALNGFRTIVYNVIKKVQFNLLRQYVRFKTLFRPISTYFNNINASEKDFEKLLSKDFIMMHIVTSIQRWTLEPIAT